MVAIPHIYHLLPGLLMQGNLPSQCTEPLKATSTSSETCKRKPELKFHFDVSTGFCMNFLWNGCGRMGNKFDDVAQCTSTCLKENYKGCPFNRNPVIVSHCYSNKDCNRQSNNPTSLYCTQQGICCERKDLNELRSAFNVTCPPGRFKVQYTYKSTMRLLIGKTCASKMCPEKATCHQKRYFAFCCQ